MSTIITNYVYSKTPAGHWSVNGVTIGNIIDIITFKTNRLIKIGKCVIYSFEHLGEARELILNITILDFECEYIDRQIEGEIGLVYFDEEFVHGLLNHTSKYNALLLGIYE